jgi:DNA topoisomerase IB
VAGRLDQPPRQRAHPGLRHGRRRPYLYHPAWQEQQAQAKYDRVLDLARRLPAIRRRITRDLRRERLGRDRVLAGVLRMLDTGAFRTGGDEYAETYGSHGVTTLERRHVTVHGAELHFTYDGKSGQHQDVTLRDRDLAALVVSLRRARTGTDRLFVYHEHGEWHEVRAPQVNDRFKELAGEPFTVKDLRTWQATVRAAIFLAEAPEPASESSRRSLLTEVMKRVADDLGNTPAVARSAYVDPRVVEQQEEGRTIARPLDRIGSDDLSRPAKRAAIESSVIRLLSRA